MKVSKVSVLYVYIYIYIYIDVLCVGLGFKLAFAPIFFGAFFFLLSFLLAQI